MNNSRWHQFDCSHSIFGRLGYGYGQFFWAYDLCVHHSYCLCLCLCDFFLWDFFFFFFDFFFFDFFSLLTLDSFLASSLGLSLFESMPLFVHFSEFSVFPETARSLSLALASSGSVTSVFFLESLSVFNFLALVLFLWSGEDRDLPCFLRLEYLSLRLERFEDFLLSLGDLDLDLGDLDLERDQEDDLDLDLLKRYRPGRRKSRIVLTRVLCKKRLFVLGMTGFNLKKRF